MNGTRRFPGGNALLAIGAILFVTFVLLFVLHVPRVQTVEGTVQAVSNQSITIEPSMQPNTQTTMMLTPFTPYETVTGRGNLDTLRQGQIVAVQQLDVLGVIQVAMEVNLKSLPGSPSHW